MGPWTEIFQNHALNKHFRMNSIQLIMLRTHPKGSNCNRFFDFFLDA